MHSHPNARLTQRGRLRLICQHLDQGRSLPELAADVGISLRCAYKWLARFRAGGPAALADRRSVRRHQRRTLDPQQLQKAVDLRHQRLHLRHIARLLAAPFSTVARTLSREWAYTMAFQNSQERNAWLPRYLSIYNRIRKHSALGWRSPQQRLHELLC